MKHINYAVLMVAIYVVSQTQLYAQNWQWGQRGGSADGSIGGGADEYARDIATDPNGNTYVLARSVGATSLNIAGTTKATFGSYDIMLSSFNCEGILRWSKVIGSTREDFSYAVRTDDEGGVYFTFNSSMFSGSGTNELHFDTDKTITINNTNGGKSYKSLFLAKYDTSGNYQWVVIPQADTVSVWSFTPTATIDLFVDKNGNIDWFCHLPKGQYNGNYTVSKTGNYIMQFDKNGSFKNGLELDMYAIGAATGFKLYFVKDIKLNRFYVSGTVNVNETVRIGNNSIKGTKYIAAFSSNGSLLWSRSDTIFSINNGITNRPAIDDSGNIYVSANTRKGHSFNDYITTAVTNSGTVMLMKMTKDGDLIWATNAGFTSAAIFSYGVALRNSGEVVFTGTNVGPTKWSTYSYSDSISTPDASYRPFIAKFNTQTGKILSMEDLVADGGNAYPADIISDNRNNVYISGEFKSKLNVNGNALSSVGGPKDFYIAKYGHSNCNCNDIPEPKFTRTVTNHFTYDFTYTGSAATIIEWDFGDGTTSTQANPSHTYTSPNDFIACVKVTNNCGDNIYCAKISTKWPDNISTLSSNSNVKIYPNPVSDILHIDGISPGSRIELYDVLGRKVHMITTASEKEIIRIAHLPQGNYFIQITLSSGERITGKVLKQ